MESLNSTPRPKVLIVGAGPTGLTLALALTLRGVPCRIVERITVRSDKSRAIVLHPRSMEYMRLLGVDAAFVDAQKSTDVEAFILGLRVGVMHFGDYASDDTRFPYITFVSQEVTERTLESRLSGLGVHVEYGVELTGMTQDDAGVTATLRVAGGVEEVLCDYIVGCDGAHSKVRKELEITFAGEAYPQTFLLADVRIDWNLSHENLRVFLGRRGVLAFFPLEGTKLSRIILMRPPHAHEEERDPTLAEIETLTRKYTHRHVRLSHPHWLSRFHLHHRGVGVYRLGRGFVAGDAAHIHSPVGGQGMNTGIQDAINLAWKLAWVINKGLTGAAATTVLDSYHSERHPVGQRLLQTTDRLFQVAATGNLALATLRNIAAPLVLPIVSRSRIIRRRAFRFISQLGIRYRQSPLNLSPWQGKDKQPQAGNRMPDINMGDGRWLYDLFSHGGMTVVGIDADLTGLDHRWMTVSLTTPAAKSRYHVDGKALFVVRPDAHILLRLDDENATAAGLAAAVEKAPWLHF